MVTDILCYDIPVPPDHGVGGNWGTAVLVFITVANQILSRHSQSRAMVAGQKAVAISDQIRTEAEVVQAMGMGPASFTRWKFARAEALHEYVRATNVGGVF